MKFQKKLVPMNSSLYLPLPREVREHLEFTKDSIVTIDVSSDVILIKKATEEEIAKWKANYNGTK